jgi:hypothetical protein
MNVCVGTVLPPPKVTVALCGLPGPDVDTDQAAVIAAAAMMIAMVMILRMSSLHLWIDSNDRHCRWRAD